MAWYDIFSSSLGYLSSSFGSNSKIAATVIGIVILIFISYFLVSRGGSRFGSWRTRWPLRHLGYGPVDVEGHTSRGILRSLTTAIKESINAGRLARKAGKQSGKMGKDAGNSTSALIAGEESVLEVTLHQASVAAGSQELVAVIQKPVNAGLKDDEAKRRIEEKLRSFEAEMADISNVSEIDERARNFIAARGMQMTSSFIELANNEDLELNIRKNSFAEAYDLLEVEKEAEQFAQTTANRAIKKQAKLKKFTEVDARDLETFLKGEEEKAQEKIKILMEAYRKAADANEKNTIMGQINLSLAVANQIKQNIKILLQILEQLKGANIRMLQALENAYSDIRNALELINMAIAKVEELRAAEKNIDRQASALKSATRNAEADFKAIQNKNPEDIILTLTTDTANIMNSLINISKSVLEVDTNDLMGFMKTLLSAMQWAYKAEETERLANNFYEKLLRANEEFFRLVSEADLSKEVKDTFTQEYQLEAMEEKIALREEGVEQAVKPIFISAITTIKNSIGMISQHIDYLNNNINFMEEIKNYTFDVLTSVMSTLTARKMEFGGKFADEARRYQEKLNGVRESANIAKGQMPIVSRLVA